MSPYRNPIPTRQTFQTNEIMRYAGFTGIWRQYISASAGIAVAGFGSAVNYREQTITAMLGGQGGSIVAPNRQRQAPLGYLENGDLRIVTEQRLSNRDEFVWRNVRYRVEADSQPSQLNGYWLSVLTRGDN